MQTWDDLRTVHRLGRFHVEQRRLTDEQAADIRHRYATTTVSLRTLAAEYGLGKTAIHDLLTQRTYRQTVSEYRAMPKWSRPPEPMPCRLNQRDRATISEFATATEASNAAHMAAWWEMDARIQAANDAWDALEMAAD